MSRIDVKGKFRILICFIFVSLIVLGGCTEPPTEGTLQTEVQQEEETQSTDSGADDNLDTSGFSKINLNTRGPRGHDQRGTVGHNSRIQQSHGA